MAVGCGEIAAIIHADMVEDDSNGYSWSPRKGEDGLGVKTIVIDGREYSYDRGSWDCSSSAIKSWREAIKYTAYAGLLDGAETTYDMRAVFTASGLFEWQPMSFIASRGDLYLDEDQHVAMCQSQDPDVMSEFSINENGEVYGGQPGDQTGWEAAINPFRDAFDGILHYNGKADGASGGSTPAPAPTPKRDAEQPKWRVRQDGKWLAEGECGRQGRPITAIAVDMPGWYQVQTKNDGWLPPVTGYDVGDPENGYAGEEQADNHIIAVRCYYETQEPAETGYYAAKYRVSDLDAGWHPYQYDDDVDESQDGYAGDEYPVDRFEICIERV